MSNLVYPASIPGLTYDSVRTPNFNTGVQQALSGKESRIAYQQYVLMSWDLKYEVLRDNLTVGELQALFGLHMAMAGKYDDFLYVDPQFNTVAGMQFAVGDGTTAAFQITATYQNAGGPGAAELVQNFNGTPQIYVGGTLQTSGTAYTLGATGVVTFLAGHIPGSGAAITWTGSFFYRARFDDDAPAFTQIMGNLWKVECRLRQVKL